MKPLLSIENLHIEFGNKTSRSTAVNGISLELQKGQTLGIVGESGSGKSVTSLSVMRLLDPKSAHIRADKMHFESRSQGGVNLLDLPQKSMRNIRGAEIAMIFQEPMTSLNPVYTCGFQVDEMLKVHTELSAREIRQKTLSLFEEVELPDPERIYKSYPHELSGGQKQRVMIAMAMSCEPDLLIADEPTTALDVTVQKRILELMNDLKKRVDMSMIFITHDLGVVAEIADKIAVMYRGEVVEYGDTQQIFKNPQHPYTKGLIACRPPLNVRYERLPVVADYTQSETEFRPVIIDREERQIAQNSLYAQSPMMEIQDLSVIFPVRNGWGRKTGEVKAVNSVSFKVYPGETLGLVGESGCGKTTLSRALLQLIQAQSGRVCFEGKDLCQLSEKEMRKKRKDLQIIFQDPYSSLNPRRTVGQAIREPMDVHGIGKRSERRQRVVELLEKVGLSAEHYDRYPHEFSGGQRQRIGIARALAVEPKFIICDESVSALDVSVQAQVLNLLNDLKREMGLTYIFISHDLSVVKYMSDRMIVMNQGVIEEYGDADEIYARPKTAYTQKLIGAIPRGLETKKLGD